MTHIKAKSGMIIACSILMSTLVAHVFFFNTAVKAAAVADAQNSLGSFKYTNNIPNMIFGVSGSKEMSASQAKTPPSYPSIRTSCTNGWYITGYFTPLESDYKSVRTKTVNVQGYGKVTLNNAFLKQVMVEGFGKTKQGWYISYWAVGPHWHRTEANKGPLDELGNKLVAGQTVAVDPKVIPFESKLTIPTLPSPWKTKTFIATDIGGAIIGKHIDVYTGLGLAARDETFRITGNGNTVCL